MFGAHMEIVSIEQEMRERHRVYEMLTYTQATRGSNVASVGLLT